MLPGQDGFTLTRELRARKKSLPILMLTALDGLEDRVKGLQLGADDYLVKPFHLVELRARVHALLRRALGDGSNQVTVGRCVLDRSQRRVWFGGDELHLSGTEYALLEFLVLHPEGYFNRDELLEHAWPGETSVDPAHRGHLHSLPAPQAVRRRHRDPPRPRLPAAGLTRFN